ncbi:hypothetical protein ACETK8_15815 [Brevundimonas staleyi]|uniref:Uncharacterized protein n=1 Tax=Brevundimonas staleyi TaxID=74326 RepID=A0ABW0FZB9_9CAUL
MSKPELSKTPPPQTPSRLKKRLMRTTHMHQFVKPNDELAMLLAFDAWGIRFSS